MCGRTVSFTQTLQVCRSLNRLAGVGASRIPALTCGAHNAHQVQHRGNIEMQSEDAWGVGVLKQTHAGRKNAGKSRRHGNDDGASGAKRVLIQT